MAHDRLPTFERASFVEGTMTMFAPLARHALFVAYSISMAAEVTGTVHGKTVTLDEPVPPLEGRRVRVSLEPLVLPTEDLLTVDEQMSLLREWAARGPQGPIDAEDEWPDESH